VGDGIADDTAALQAALDDGYLARMAVLLPAGRTFLVSRQLRAIEAHGMPPSSREYGYQLVGGRSTGTTPALIRVADRTDPIGFPSLFNTSIRGGTVHEARPVLRFALLITPGGSNDSPSLCKEPRSACWDHKGSTPLAEAIYLTPPGHACNTGVLTLLAPYQSTPYPDPRYILRSLRGGGTDSAMLRNVDFDLGDNPSLSGVAMSGAQLCSIEDVRVRGAAFTAGAVNLPGSGGFTANLEVVGGSFAVWQNAFRPNPSVQGQ